MDFLNSQATLQYFESLTITDQIDFVEKIMANFDLKEQQKTAVAEGNTNEVDPFNFV